MKKATSHSVKIFSLIAVVGALLSFGVWETVFATAGVSNYLSYQGRLTDTSGNPLGGAGTNYCFSFSVFDAASGGSKLWPTTATTTTILNVVSGVFNASIGDVSTVNFSANDTQYLNVDVATQVGGVCTGVVWETLLPRQKLDSVAYARTAHDVYGGDVQVGNASGTSGNFLKLDWKNTADTLGGACAGSSASQGWLWFNSSSGFTRVCNNNIIKSLSGLTNDFFDISGPTAARTFAFPDASATVLTSAAAVTIGQGGTGTTTATNAFNALSPITTKGDLISKDTTNNVRLGVGTNGQVLTASSTAAAGIAWATISAGGTNALLDGTSHTDTTAGTVARGDIITGQTATPKWTRLAKGTADQVLAMDATATDVIWKTLTGGGSPGGADTQLQFNNGGAAFAGDADLTWASSTNKLTLGGADTGITMKAITNEPAVPSAGTGQLYVKSIGGRVLPKFVGPSGIDFAVQPLMAQDKVAIWSPPGNAVTLPGVFGFTAPTLLGTVTLRNVATTRMFTRIRRLGYVSSAVAGNFAGHYGVATGAQWTVGDGAGLGGFFYVTRFGDSSAATVAGSREFVGMTSTVAAPTNVEPSTLTNSIGVGHGTADTNLKLYYGGSAAQTPIDLGASFPIRTLSTDMYELVLFASPATTTAVGYKVTRLNTNNVAEGTISGAAGTAIPASTTLLGHRAWITNQATALAVGMDIASVYISSDY